MGTIITYPEGCCETKLTIHIKLPQRLALRVFNNWYNFLHVIPISPRGNTSSIKPTGRLTSAFSKSGCMKVTNPTGLGSH